MLGEDHVETGRILLGPEHLQKRLPFLLRGAPLLGRYEIEGRVQHNREDSIARLFPRICLELILALR